MISTKHPSYFLFLAAIGFTSPVFAQSTPATTAPVAAPTGTSPFAAMAAPKAADDLTGSIGFGVGVVAGSSLIAPNSTLKLKYWMHNDLAVMPQLNLFYAKTRRESAPRSNDATWAIEPQVTVLYVPWRATTTRLSVGAGLGISLGSPNPGNDTEVGFNIPIYAGLEHFFTRWFSMGIGLSQDFLGYGSGQNDAWSMGFGVNTTRFDGFLMFYTD